MSVSSVVYTEESAVGLRKRLNQAENIGVQMRVILVDACPVFREGLKCVMNGIHDVAVVAEAGTYRDVREKIHNESDLLLVDGDLEALALLRELDKAHRLRRPPFVLVLSARTDDYHAVQLLAAGADGYI